VSWYLIVVILLVAILRQQRDLVVTRHRVDDIVADNLGLHREVRALRKLRAPLAEERRAAVRWSHLPKEYP